MLDELAKNGVLFTNAFSNGPCTPLSFPSLFTSTYPLEHQVVPGPWIKSPAIKLTHSCLTIAEVLKRKGFFTIMFHSNPFLSSYFGYGRGYDLFRDLKSLGESRYTRSTTKMRVKRKVRGFLNLIDRTPLITFWRNYIRFLFEGLPYATGVETNEAVMNSLLNLNKAERKLFLWIHYMDPHAPYICPPDLMEKFQFKSINFLRQLMLWGKMKHGVKKVNKHELSELVNLYKAELRCIDYTIRKLLDNLKEVNITRRNTYFIITSDHGEEFGEHGGFEHGFKLYDELLHVPLIISGPNINKQIIQDPVSLIDLPPTILDLINVKKPSTFRGESLLPLVNREERKENNYKGIISEAIEADGVRGYSYRTREWKYILLLSKKGKKEELYNLVDDPNETVNLSEEGLKNLEEFREKIFTHIRREERRHLDKGFSYFSP